MDVGILADRIACDFFKYPAGIIFAEKKFCGKIVQGKCLFAVLGQVIGNLIYMPELADVRIEGTLLRVMVQFPGEPEKIGGYGKLYSLLVIVFLVPAFLLEQVVQIHELLLLPQSQMIDAVVLMEKTYQLQSRIFPIQILHAAAADIEDDPVMSGVVLGNGFGHVDQVGVYQDQIPLGGNKIAVIKEKKTFSLQDIEDFIFVVKMLHTHIKLSVPDHVFQGNTVDGGVVGYFFQNITCFLFCTLLQRVIIGTVNLQSNSLQRKEEKMKMNETELRRKLDLVIEKLLNLGGPENEKELEETGGEAIGFFKRDFGIREWDWPQGVGLYGLLRIMRQDKSEKYKEFLHNWFVGNMELGLPSRNINTTTPLLTLAELNEYYHDPKFEELCLSWADWLMNCIPRTKEGGFQHVTSANGDRQGVRLNENEMWIDTLFMTVLFLNKMGQKYEREEWVNESIHQMLMHIKYLHDKKTGLFYHGWTFNGNHNFGGVFWCRGNSWFTLGSMEYIEMSRGNLNPGVKELIVDTYKAQAAALKKLQSRSGLWYTVLTDPESYEEVSGSAAIAAGMLKGVRFGILDDSYLECAGRAIKGILENIDEDGTVLKVSGGTGMGMDAEHYKNILIAPMAYGQALTILALAEALLH